MAQPRLPELYVECRITHRQAEPTEVDVHEPESPELGFELCDAAGSFFHDAEDLRGLAWTMNQEVRPANDEPCKPPFCISHEEWRLILLSLCSLQDPFKLHLKRFSIEAQPQQPDVALSFAHALLPHVAMDASNVYALTAGGYLHSIQLPGSQQATATATEQHSEVSTSLVDLTAGMSLPQLALIYIRAESNPQHSLHPSLV